MNVRWGPIVVLLAACGGCTTYQFDILQPPTQNRRISTDGENRLVIDPLEYRLRAAQGRLVMLIFNPTGDTIELLGSKSSVVDPDGQSHPLRDRAIAGDSFIKEILPPYRPQWVEPQPSYGVGVSGMAGAADQPGYVRPRGYGSYPSGVDVYDDADAYFWDWDDQTEVRMTLVFSRSGKTFEQSLVFHRVKK